MKYLKQIVLFFLFFVLLNGVIIASEDPVAFFVLLLPISGVLGVIIGYVLAPIFLFIYKKIIGRKMLFDLQERSNPEKFRGTFKGFFPSLMAANFALLLIFEPSVMDFPLFQGFYGNPSTIILMFFILCTLTMILAMSLFSAVWFLMDAGIVVTNKKKVENTNNPVEVQSIGRWYLRLLKGYSGISVLISLYTFLINMYDKYGGQMHFSIPIFIIPLPIFLSLWILPAILLFDVTFKNRKRYIQKYAKKLGIQKGFSMQINEISEN